MIYIRNSFQHKLFQCFICILLFNIFRNVIAETPKEKRQIFREQVLPHKGGKIPEGAFRTDRLALNKLKKEGIFVPDGVILQSRKHHHHHAQQDNPEHLKDLVKVIQTPDGRFTAPAGRYYQKKIPTVDTTYIIRSPIGPYKQDFKQQKPTKIINNLPFVPSQPVHLRPDHHLQNNVIPDIKYFDNLKNQEISDFLFNGYNSLFSDHLQPFYSVQEDVDEFGHLFKHLLGEKSAFSSEPSFPELSYSLPEQSGYKEYDAYYFPNYKILHETTFTCDSVAYKGRMYADPDSKCKVFHYCHPDGRMDSFLCPKGTIFNEITNQCEWYYKCG